LIRSAQSNKYIVRSCAKRGLTGRPPWGANHRLSSHRAISPWNRLSSKTKLSLVAILISLFNVFCHFRKGTTAKRLGTPITP